MRFFLKVLIVLTISSLYTVAELKAADKVVDEANVLTNTTPLKEDLSARTPNLLDVSSLEVCTDKAVNDIPGSRSEKPLKEYLASEIPRLLEVPALKPLEVYYLLLEGTFPPNRKWNAFTAAWDHLDHDGKTSVLRWFSVLSLENVFIMKENLPQIKLWIEALLPGAYNFKFHDNTMFYRDFESYLDDSEWKAIIKWVYESEDSDEESSNSLNKSFTEDSDESEMEAAFQRLET